MEKAPDDTSQFIQLAYSTFDSEQAPGVFGPKRDQRTKDMKSNVLMVVLTFVVGALVIAMMGVFYAHMSYASDDFTNISNEESTPKARHRAGVSNIQTSKPNFVFILIDDLGWNSMGYQGYDFNGLTPNMDNLANNGIVMGQYYAQESCTPSRAALLTGRYPSTNGVPAGGVQDSSLWTLNASETLFPEVMQRNGYKTYMLGKWHLGFYRPEYLPTSRGFDEFVGYLSGAEYYWDKLDYPTTDGSYYDFIVSDTKCYDRQETDNQYSTYFYDNKAVAAIKTHDFSSQPMFMYFASQAVHAPFNYDSTSDTGIPMSYIGEAVYESIKTTVKASAFRQQMGISLYILDQAVGSITQALSERGQLDNTYIIVSSDNGGCSTCGGLNGPLRGNKGTLFEGGTKVNSFISSPKISSESKGRKYNGLMHITDWFPTILELAGITYSPASGYALDGVSQVSAMLSNTDSISSSSQTTSPREYMLYNVYVKYESEEFDLYENTYAAVRDGRYKLMHTYTSDANAQWYSVYDDYSGTLDNDLKDGSGSECNPSFSGTFEYLLFDLQDDWAETTNLYNHPEYRDVQERLTKKLVEYANDAIEVPALTSDSSAGDYWAANGGFVQPWINTLNELKATTESAASSADTMLRQYNDGTATSKSSTSQFSTVTTPKRCTSKSAFNAI